MEVLRLVPWPLTALGLFWGGGAVRNVLLLRSTDRQEKMRSPDLRKVSLSISIYRRLILTTPESTLAQFNTNVFGLLNVTREFLSYMRERRAGCIANMGLIGGWEGGKDYILLRRLLLRHSPRPCGQKS